MTDARTPAIRSTHDVLDGAVCRIEIEVPTADTATRHGDALSADVAGGEHRV